MEGFTASTWGEHPDYDVRVSGLASGIYTVKAEYFTIRFVKGK